MSKAYYAVTENPEEILSCSERMIAPALLAIGSIGLIGVGIAACSTLVGCVAGAPLIAAGAAGVWGSVELGRRTYVNRNYRQRRWYW